MNWQSNATLSDELDGTYLAAHQALWGTGTNDWRILWEITQSGNTASVVTVDMDSDGIPGTAMIAGPFSEFSHEVNGTLTAVVPLPAAAWLLGSGLIGLTGVAGRRSRSWRSAAL